MALVVADRVKEVTTTTGTGAISLGGAQANFVTFSSALSDGDTTYYAIVDNDNVAYEVGLGTYASSGNTLTRTTVLDSSNSGSAVSFGTGQKDVFVTYPADKSVYGDATGNVAVTSLTAAGLAYPTSDGSTDQFLKTNGSGTLAFADVPAGIESTFTVQTSNFTSVASVRYYISTAGGAVTMTLPASPTAGDQVAFVDYTGNFATTAAVLGRNGSNIMGSASDMNLDVDYFSGTVEYVDATQGWKLI
jgi:hypothetical protein